MKYLKIKLMILNNLKINLSNMFKDCKSLKEFSIKTNDEIKQEDKFKEKEEKNNQIENSNKHCSQKSDNESNIFNNKFIEIENNINKNKSIIYNNFYCSHSKDNITEDELGKIHEIIISSYNFTTNLSEFNYSRFLIKNNNHIFCSINESLKPLILELMENDSNLDKDKINSNNYYQLELKKNKINVVNISFMFYNCSKI